MDIRLVRGPRAVELLEDPAFGRSWQELLKACPWGGTFQDPRFVRIWHDHYQHEFELLCLKSGPDEALEGLLMLARPPASNALVAAGGHHAEYQAWLARDAKSGEQFIEGSLHTLQRTFPRGRLRLGFLFPGVPLGWVRRQPWLRLAELQVEPGAWMETNGQHLTGRLARRKLRKLASLGPDVHLETMTDAEVLERDFETFRDLCDFRQAAINDVRPFRQDPHKGPFHIDLLRRAPDLMHVSRLVVDGRVLSTQLNMRHRGEVLVCVQGHRPDVARLSPGFCHRVLLARSLSTEGVQSLDLSPGGGYKQQNATRTAPTHILHVHFSRLAAARRNARTRTVAALRSTARRGFRDANRFEARARRILDGLSTPRTVTRSVGAALRAQVGERVVFLCLALDGDAARRLVEGPVSVNRLADLLDYAPSSPAQPSRFEFCQRAAQRLAYGQRVYTDRGARQRLRSIWSAQGPCTVDLESLRPAVRVPDDEMLLHDAMGTLEPRKVAAWIRHATTNDTQRVLWAIPLAARRTREMAESLGFDLAFEWIVVRRRGKLQQEGNVPDAYTPPESSP